MKCPPKTTVIVVGTNEKKWLESCFQSLCIGNYVNMEIIYIDNASSDKSIEYVSRTHPSIKIICNATNAGFAKANNQGIEYALSQESKYIFLVNPDTITPPDLISDLVQFLEKNLIYGIVGPLQMQYDDKTKLNTWSMQALKNKERHALYKWDPDRVDISDLQQGRADFTLEHAYVQGSAFFIRADLLSKTTSFNEIYHTYYEEVDLCRRARWVGYKVAVLLNLHIQHYGGGGTGQHSAYRNFYYSRNKYIYLMTDPEYDFHQISKIFKKWIRRDFNDSVYVHKDLTNLIQLGRIYLSLILCWTKISRIRRENVLLYKSGRSKKA